MYSKASSTRGHDILQRLIFCEEVLNHHCPSISPKLNNPLRPAISDSLIFWLWGKVYRWKTHKPKTNMTMEKNQQFEDVRPWKPTYPPKIDGWKMKYPFKMVPFRGHVNFWAGYLLLKMVNCHVSFRAVYVRGCLLRLTFWWCWQVSHLAMPFFGWCCRREVIRGLHFYYTPRTVWCEPPLTNRAFARDFVGKWPRLKHRPAKNSHEPRKNPSYFPIIHCLKIPETQPFAHEIIQKIWANSRSTNYIT